MRWLPALSKIAFVCNLLFVLSAALQWKAFIPNGAVASTIVIGGYFLAVFVFSPLVSLLYLAQWRLRGNLFGLVPRWLVVVNVMFLLIQGLFIIFYLNDPFNY